MNRKDITGLQEAIYPWRCFTCDALLAPSFQRIGRFTSKGGAKDMYVMVGSALCSEGRYLKYSRRIFRRMVSRIFRVMSLHPIAFSGEVYRFLPSIISVVCRLFNRCFGTLFLRSMSPPLQWLCLTHCFAGVASSTWCFKVCRFIQ